MRFPTVRPPTDLSGSSTEVSESASKSDTFSTPPPAAAAFLSRRRDSGFDDVCQRPESCGGPHPAGDGRVASRRLATTCSTSSDGLADVVRVEQANDRLGALPRRAGAGHASDAYLWARTITCPYCDGLIPLSPNWRLAPDGTGVRLHPDPRASAATSRSSRTPRTTARAPSTGGDAKCPYRAAVESSTATR